MTNHPSTQVYACLLLIIGLIVGGCSMKNHESYNFKLNEESSQILWKGSAADHFHTGSFKISGEFAAFEDGLIKSGHFNIPIASIENFDLVGPVREQLLTHLKSIDFFNIEVYPNAKFDLTKIEPLANNNYIITGKLSMLGKSHDITFPAKISIFKHSIQVKAKFKLDRTKWGMTHESDPSKPLFIYPEVELELQITGDKTN